VIFSGGLALLGIHNGNSTGGSDGVADALSADILLPHYVTALSRSMNDEQVSVVPEPGRMWRTPEAIDRLRQRGTFYAVACVVAGIIGIGIAVWWVRRPDPAE